MPKPNIKHKVSELEPSQKENPIIGACWINGKLVCELREKDEPDVSPDTDWDQGLDIDPN